MVLPTLADSGYDSAGIGIHTPIRQTKENHPQHRQPACTALANAAFPFSKPLTDPPANHQQLQQKIDDVARPAPLVLTCFEHNHLSEIHCFDVITGHAA
jgi:hypothetical protein